MNNHYDFIIGPTDTDSVSFCKANMDIFTKEEIKTLIQELNDLSPEFMIWSDDGYYEKCIALKAKNYILKKQDELIIKGSALKDTKKELALKEFLNQIITNLLEYDINYENLISIYNKYITEAMNISDINRWTVKKTITKKVLEGERKNETKIMDALEGQVLQEGDKVWVYSAIDGLTQVYAKGEPVFLKNGEPKMEENCILKIPTVWTKDEDKLHYVQRVYKTLEIFSNILDMSKFTKYHLVKNKEALLKLTSI